MRNRLEDLGRLLVLLDQILDHEIFQYRGRVKDFPEFFYDDNKDILMDKLEELGYSIDSVRLQLLNCLEIAKGEDYLNEHVL